MNGIIMGGYFTQSRLLSPDMSALFLRPNQPIGVPPIIESVNNGSGYSGNYDDARNSDVRTYSYRTTKPSGDYESESFGLPELMSELNTEAYDTGHEFHTEERRFLGGRNHLDLYAGLSKDDGWYSGPVFLRGPRGGSPSGLTYAFISPPAMNVSSYGPLAISKTIPTTPVSGIAQFAGELKEGIPHLIGAALIKSRSSAFKALGSEYLNYQFGWLPFVKDIMSLCNAVINAKSILTQYRRDAGKIVRRRWNFSSLQDSKIYPDMTSSSNSFLWTGFRFTGGGDWFQRGGRPGTFSESESLHQEYWFSGAYTYLLNEDDSFLGRLELYSQYAEKLLSLKITPEVLWELAPWSWLFDWEFNIGVNITNATRFQNDRLLIKYGYLMRKSISTHTIFVKDAVTSNGNRLPTLAQSYVVTRKERVKSTPYGFGLNPSSFTAGQWSILAALGMTKGPRSLK